MFCPCYRSFDQCPRPHRISYYLASLRACADLPPKLSSLRNSASNVVRAAKQRLAQLPWTPVKIDKTARKQTQIERWDDKILQTKEKPTSDGRGTKTNGWYIQNGPYYSIVSTKTWRTRHKCVVCKHVLEKYFCSSSQSSSSAV